MQLEKLIPNLMVKDVDITLNYYHGVLGFETVNTWKNSDGETRSIRMKKGDIEIIFQSEESMKREIPELRHEHSSGGLTLLIMVSNVQEYYDHWYENLDVVVQMKDTPQGLKQFTIRDINGFFLTFAEPL